MLIPSLFLCVLLLAVLQQGQTQAQEIAIDADQERYEAHDQEGLLQQQRRVEVAADSDPRIVVHASYHRTDAVREELRMFPQDVDVANSRGWTSLTYACANGFTDLVRVLLDAKANVNYIEADGWTPIMFAVFQGHFDIVQLLLENRAAELDLLHRNHLHASVHELAYLRMRADAYLHHENSLSLPSLIGQYSITQAMASSDFDQIMFHVDLAVRNGATMLVNVQNAQGWTPLAFASTLGRTEDVARLLEFDANVHIAENDGWTPLHFAANNGHVAVVRMLVQRGANLFARTRNSDQTAKQMAKERGFPEVVEVLIAAGDADVVVQEAAKELPEVVAAAKLPPQQRANAAANANPAPTAAFREEETDKKKKGGNFFGIF